MLQPRPRVSIKNNNIGFPHLGQGRNSQTRELRSHTTMEDSRNEKVTVDGRWVVRVATTTSDLV